MTVSSEQRNLLPHAQRPRRGHHHVPSTSRQDHVLSERNWAVNTDFLKGMVQSAHATQDGLDAPTDPRALADQPYAVNPEDHCLISIVRYQDRATTSLDPTMQFVGAGFRTLTESMSETWSQEHRSYI